MRAPSIIGPVLGLLLALLALPGLAAPVQTEHVEAELVAENTGLTAGGENWLALRLAPEQGWHVYWRHPGESGLDTAINWSLPPGLAAGDLQWPYPHRSQLGDIANY